MTDAPTIDGRDARQLRQDIERRAPYYVDEWDPDAADAGAAIVAIFSEMAADVTERLDRLPEKHFVAFLDALGFDRASPQVARLPLQVDIAEGAGQNVTVSPGTRAVAETASGQQYFEVPPGSGFEATPSKLQRLFAVDPATDRILDHREILSGVEGRLFDGTNEQRHALYLGHAELLALDAKSRLRVRVETETSAAGLFDLLDWEYYGTDANGTTNWHTLTKREARSHESTQSEPQTVSVTLQLPPESEMTTFEMEGIETRWVRGYPSDDADRTTLFDLDLASLTLGVGPGLDGSDASAPGAGAASTERRPDRLLHNDIPLALPSDGDAPEPVRPFGAVPQARETFYVASDEAFVKAGSTAVLAFTGVTGGTTQLTRLSWEYWNGNGWSRIDGLQDGTERLTQDGSVVFTVPTDLEPTVVAGHDAHWIRVRVVDSGYGRVTYTRLTERDERLGESDGSDDQTFEVDYPPMANESVWVNEVDTLTEDERGDLTRLRPDDVEAELNNGVVTAFWVRWDSLADERRNDNRNYAVDRERGTIRFGERVGGDALSDTAEVRATYEGGRWEWSLQGGEPPQFDDLTVSYGTFPEGSVAGESELEPYEERPTHLLTENNLAFSPDRATALRDGQRFRPFVGLPDGDQTLYLGFDGPLTNGPIQLLFSVVDRAYPEEFSPRVRWEYRATPEHDQWTRLPVEDGTADLLTRGIVSLVFPEETVGTERFGETFHWIRARLTSPFEDDPPSTSVGSARAAPNTASGLVPCETTVQTDPPTGTPTKTPPRLRGVYPNTGWAVNVRTVENERLGSSDGSHEQSFTAASTPVLGETVEVDELSALSASDRDALRSAHPDDVEAVFTPEGEPRAFWVRWERVDDFLDSGPDDRRYVVDWATGTVAFGDGRHGRVPPVGQGNVRVSYTTGGGEGGNVAAAAVTSLVSSLPFVAGATNPDAAEGGADAEPTATVLDRGPKEIRDRGRAVIGVDFERVALSVSRRLARVASLPGMDEHGEYAPGWVTLVIVPQSNDPQPVPSAELRSQVTARVSERSPATLVAPDHLVVRGPSYVSASVDAVLVTSGGRSVSTVERATEATIDAFLHPLTGGDNGDGWRFGELPCLSDVYALLEGVDGVDHVVTAELVFQGSGAPVTLREGEPPPAVAPDTLVYSGPHEIDGRSE